MHAYYLIHTNDLLCIYDQLPVALYSQDLSDGVAVFTSFYKALDCVYSKLSFEELFQYGAAWGIALNHVYHKL